MLDETRKSEAPEAETFRFGGFADSVKAAYSTRDGAE